MSAQRGTAVRLSYVEAVVDAIAGEMRRDPGIVMIGQDIGRFGGPMGTTRGLFEEFGPTRLLEAPISESAMVGAGIGAALFGLRPIVDISFGEFLPAAMNQLINQMPNLHYMTGGEALVPLVVRTRVGDGPYGGHPQDYSSWFAHVPGLKVVIPANAHDAKGLMTAAIRDDNPVLFVEPMSLARGGRQEVPQDPYTIEIGTAEVVRPGTGITIVALGSMVPPALRVAADLMREGISAEVVDLRCIQPWDMTCVLESVQKTGCVMTVEESWTCGGFGAEVAATVAERSLDDLMAPVGRVGALAVPIPSGPLRQLVLPTDVTIAAEARRLLQVAGRLRARSPTAEPAALEAGTA
jgi:pyruvate/2-oxoglutarate/acetoin dehydrogenase E1 component